MAWSLAFNGIRCDLAKTETRLAKIGGTSYKEQLGRGLRWLDEPEDAHTWLLDAAASVERSGGGTEGRALARAGGLLTLAGEPGAEDRLRASLGAAAPLTDADEIAGVLYLLGRHADAADASAGLESALAKARLAGDAAELQRVRSEFLRLVRADRIGPHEESGHAPYSAWDWIEETFIVEAQLTSVPAPSHADMLTATGLLRSKRVSKRSTKDLSAGTSRDIQLRAADGVEVAANATVEQDAVVLTLDPRESTWLMVTLDAESGSWGANVQTHPEEGGEGAIDYSYASADEALGAVADWLTANAPDARDGQWAAAAARTVFAALRV